MAYLTCLLGIYIRNGALIDVDLYVPQMSSCFNREKWADQGKEVDLFFEFIRFCLVDPGELVSVVGI